jgi:hypothetical protein
MMHLRTLLLLVFIAGFLAPIAQAAEVLTNGAIVSMVKSGLGKS